MNLLEFEEKIGKKLSEITMEDLNNFVNDDKVMACLNDTDITLKVAEEVLTKNPNQDVKEEFAPLKYHHLLYGSQRTLSQLFSQHAEETDKTALIDDIKNFIMGTTPLGKLSAYLLCVSTIEGFDLREYEDDIKNTVKETVNIMDSLNVEKAYPILCDLIDMLYSLQQDYYAIYDVDVVEDVDKVKEILKRIDDFSQQFYDKIDEELAKHIPEDVKPEDLGMLDMTKFKNETEKND